MSTIQKKLVPFNWSYQKHVVERKYLIILVKYRTVIYTTSRDWLFRMLTVWHQVFLFAADVYQFQISVISLLINNWYRYWKNTTPKENFYFWYSEYTFLLNLLHFHMSTNLIARLLFVTAFLHCGFATFTEAQALSTSACLVVHTLSYLSNSTTS